MNLLSLPEAMEDMLYEGMTELALLGAVVLAFIIGILEWIFDR